jgi:hypothetical protein
VFYCGVGVAQGLVVKGTRDVVGQMFAYMLFKQLAFKVPETRLVQYGDAEFKKMIRRLQTCAHRDQYVRVHLDRELDRPYIFVSEYIPNIPLSGMGNKRAVISFSYEHNFGMQRLNQIGEICAGDLLLNNSDRVPLIWETPGNSSSFLMGVSHVSITADQIRDLDFTQIRFTSVYATGTKSHCINRADRDNFIGYMQRLERYLNDVFRDLEQILDGRQLSNFNFRSVLPVRDMIEGLTGVRLTNGQLFQVLKGLVFGLCKIVHVPDSGYEEIYEGVRQMAEEDWKGIWSEGMQAVSLDFILTAKEVVDRFITQYSSEVAWVIRNIDSDEAPLYFA